MPRRTTTFDVVGPDKRTCAALFLRDLVMPLAFRVFATEKAMSWIYDYEVPWDEPVLRKAA